MPSKGGLFFRLNLFSVHTLPWETLGWLTHAMTERRDASLSNYFLS